MLPQHMTISNDLNGPLETVKQGGDIEWVVGHVNMKDGSLVQDETGKGIEDMVYCMEGDKVQFAVLRYEMSQTNRFICICWCGQGAPERLKKAYAYYTRDWEDYLRKLKYGISVTIQARSEEDLEESVIVDKLNKSTNTFVRAKKTGEAKEDLKGKASSFWSEQQKKDAQFNEDFKARQQAKERDMAESKRMEAERIAASASARNANLVANQQAKANAFRNEQMQRDEAERQRWKEQEQKHQQFVASRQQEPERWEQQQQVRGNVSGFSSKFNQMGQEEEKPQIQRTGKTWQRPAAAPEPEPAYSRPTAPRAAYKPAAPAPAPEPVYEEPQQPAYEEPAYEEPAPEPVYEEPAYEEPAPAPEPAYEEPAPAPEPAYEEPAYEQPPQEQAPQGEEYVAAYDYDATAEGDLTFREGDILYVLSCDEDGWAQAIDVNGQQGTVPMNYLEKR